MTCHSFRIKTSINQKDNPDHVPKPEHGALEDKLPDRVKEHIKYNFNPVCEDQDSPMCKCGGESTIDDRPEHVSGVYRFSGSDAKKNILDSIESKVICDCKWYKIESHECTHDGSTRIVEKTDTDGNTYTEEVKGCGDWKTERINGNVPEGI